MLHSLSIPVCRAPTADEPFENRAGKDSEQCNAGHLTVRVWSLCVEILRGTSQGHSGPKRAGQVDIYLFLHWCRAFSYDKDHFFTRTPQLEKKKMEVHVFPA